MLHLLVMVIDGARVRMALGGRRVNEVRLDRLDMRKRRNSELGHESASKLGVFLPGTRDVVPDCEK
jgi:hypothetical protein